MILIEHHTGLLAACDELVELGPAGGEAGGRVIAIGTPDELVRDPRSITGPFLSTGSAPRTQSPTRGKRIEALR